MRNAADRGAATSRYIEFFIVLIGVLSVICLIWWIWFHNPLPSDAEMIERFNANRAGFEQLVQGYRNHRPSRTMEGSTSFKLSAPWVKPLMRKLEVYSVVEAQGASGRWYPDPYSPRVLQTLRFLYTGRSVHQRATQEEIMETLRRDIPDLFKQTPEPLRDILDVTRVTTVTHVFLGSEDQPYDRVTLPYFGNRIIKSYYFFPQVPRIEHGHILVPHESPRYPGYRLGQRVFDSLDGYPPNWKQGECVLKPIDSQWFIAMCRSA